jgi:hypothetical protein
MKPVYRMLRAALLGTLKPYRVTIVWAGGVFVHRAWTSADALSWIAAYPRGAWAYVETRGARVTHWRLSVR